jgi:hypothetical protein
MLHYRRRAPASFLGQSGFLGKGLVAHSGTVSEPDNYRLGRSGFRGSSD